MFGGSAGLLIAVTGLDFGQVQIGTTSPAQIVEVTNLNAGSVVIAVTGGAPTDALFALIDGCDGKSLAKGESCELAYTFAPTALGAVTATSSGSVNGQPFEVALSGIGFPPRFRITPTSVHFGVVQLGSSAEEVVQVTNVGLAPVVNADFVAAPPLNPAFSLTETCEGETLDVGESCEVHFTFTPTALGGAGTFWLLGVSGAAPSQISLAGVGIPSGSPAPNTVLVSPGGLAFGDVQIGETSAQQSVNVKNIGAIPIPITLLGGTPNVPAFTMTQDCHLRLLAPGASCQISYAFRPTIPGPTPPTATSTFLLNNEQISIDLSGFGLPARLRVSPTGFDFGGVGVFTTSEPQLTTVTNAGIAPVTVDLSDGVPTPVVFGATNDCQGVTLDPGASCQISYAFSPATIGAAQGTSSGKLNGTDFSVGLRGEGVSPYAVNGFAGSIVTPPGLNAAKAGQVLPLVFDLGGDFGLNIFAAGFPVSGTIACGSSGPPAATQPTASPRDTPLSYDPRTSRYTYTWKTEKDWKATCRQAVLQLNDGTTLKASFEFK